VVDIGYTLMGEQRSPKDLVRDAVLAEQAGFDYLVASDHYFPWLALVQIGDEQEAFCDWFASTLKPALAGI